MDPRYKWYLDRSGENRDWALRLNARLDQLIFLLASGAIVFSVTFISKIVGSSNVDGSSYLVWSWILLFVTLLFNLLSFVFGLFSSRASEKQLFEWYTKGEKENPNLDNVWGITMESFHYASLLFLIIGLALMAYFIQLNFVPNFKLW